MSQRKLSNSLIVACALACLVAPGVVEAQITIGQRREIADIRREVGKVTGLVRKKDYDAARELLDEAESQLKGIVEAAGIEASDRAVAPVFTLIESRRTAVEKASGNAGAGGVSFVEEVAPILAENCLGCHAGDARGGLRLDTFANMERGGSSGPLLVIGRPRNSLIMARIMHPNPAQRMPRGQPALSPAEIETIGKWIAAGAKFDGNDKELELSRLEKQTGPPKKVEIAMATGDETVSFTKDIAPFMARLCVNCHSGANPRGGLSLVTFEDLMRGGDSGEVLIPGNLEDSRLWRLVGGLENPRMPQGQGRITRQNYNDLKTWIEEGIKYDGEDPKIPLREFVPSAEEMLREKLNAMSPEEFVAHRKERTERHWKRAMPRAEAQSVETENFILHGDVPASRLERIGGWAEEHVAELKKSFNVEDSPVWKGKLTIFVTSDRFGYEEFNRTIHDREVPETIVGHAHVTPAYDDAYIVVQELGDAPTPDEPSLQMTVVENVTAAFLQRGSGDLPDWVLRGAGLAMAGNIPDAQPYLRGLQERAKAALGRVNRPEDLFADGTFSPGEVAAVGYTLVDFLIDAQGPAKFGQLVARLRNGDDMQAAVTAVYRANLQSLAAAYAAAMAK